MGIKGNGRVVHSKIVLVSLISLGRLARRMFVLSMPLWVKSEILPLSHFSVSVLEMFTPDTALNCRSLSMEEIIVIYNYREKKCS